MEDVIDRQPETLDKAAALLSSGTADQIGAISGEIAKARSMLRKTLTADESRRLRTYIAAAEDTKGLLRGMNKFFAAAPYMALAGQALTAPTDDARSRALSEMVSHVGAEVRNYGIGALTARLFGKEVAAVLGGPAFVLAEVASPTETAPDWLASAPDRVITSPRYSLEEKRRALAAFWRGYDRYGDSWDPNLRTRLWECTAILDRETRERPQ